MDMQQYVNCAVRACLCSPTVFEYLWYNKGPEYMTGIYAIYGELVACRANRDTTTGKRH